MDEVEVVFNNGGADLNFRVEGNSNTNLLKLLLCTLLSSERIR